MERTLRKPMVSVVMITYNHEKYIKEAVEGVLMQECDFEVELIIADDRSPDNTEAIVKSIINQHPNGHWIKYSKHSMNKGMMPNFIWALNQAKGKYIALCEGDDYWTDALKLQKQLVFLERNDEYSMVFHNYKEIDGRSVMVHYLDWNKTITKEEYAARLSGIQTLTVVFRNLLKPIIPHEYITKVSGSYFLFLRLAEIGKFKFFEDIMAVYRVHDGGIWTGKSKKEQAYMSLQNKSTIIDYLKHDKKLQKISQETFTRICLGYFIHFFIRLKMVTSIRMLMLSWKFGINRVHFFYWFTRLRAAITTRI